ncbi:MAG: hypothetical protein AAF493_01175 [Pseudomonadota bacterium]
MDHMTRAEDELTRQADTLDAAYSFSLSLLHDAPKADENVESRFRTELGSCGEGCWISPAARVL